MNRKPIVTALFGVFSLVALTACNSSGSGAPGSTAGAGSTAAAAPAPKCAPGEWAEANGKLCMKVPSGWTAGEPRISDVVGMKQTDVSFKVPSGEGQDWVSASFYYRDAGKGDYEAGLGGNKLDAEHAQKEKAGGGIEQEGNAPKGTGKYLVYRDINKRHGCYMHLLSGETHVVVRMSGDPEKALAPAAIEACKSAYMP